MNAVQRAKRDLVIANRVLVDGDVLDASGHVSIRHPDNPARFLIARSVSPGIVTLDDILSLSLEAEPEPGETRKLYVERFIHGAIYEARPDVHSVIHAHTDEVLPFSISSVPLRPVFHNSGEMGNKVPVWDIADRFGDKTRLVCTNMDHGRDLAKKLGKNTMVLMRGHGYAAASRSIILLVKMCLELPNTARVLMAARHLGTVKYMSPGEVKARQDVDPDSSSIRLGWTYYAIKAGCGGLLTD